MSERKNEQGFTLVELSIVLIIIGLIVGGVLAGQTLISSAKSQADVNNYNKMNTGAQAFYLKYGFPPGDSQTPPVTYTCTSCTAGNGNGQIGDTTITSYASEIGRAMAELTIAGLIPLPTAADYGAAAANAGNIGFPLSKTGGGMILYGDGTSNNLRFGMMNGAAATPSTSLVLEENTPMTPSQAYFIDNKIDDGVATSGIVQSLGATANTAGRVIDATNTLNTPAGVGCNSAGGVYVIATTTQQCGLKIRLSN